MLDSLVPPVYHPVMPRPVTRTVSDPTKLREAAERAQVARDQARQAFVEAQRVLAEAQKDLDAAWQRVFPTGEEVSGITHNLVTVFREAAANQRTLNARKSQRQVIEELVRARRDEFTVAQIRENLTETFPHMTATNARIKVNAVLKKMVDRGDLQVRKGHGSSPHTYRRRAPEAANSQ